MAHYLRPSQALQLPMELAELLDLCIADKKRLGKSVRYLQQFKCSCLNSIRGREGRMAHTEVETWVLGQNWAPKTQRV